MFNGRSVGKVLTNRNIAIKNIFVSENYLVVVAVTDKDRVRADKRGRPPALLSAAAAKSIASSATYMRASLICKRRPRKYISAKVYVIPS